MVVGLRRVLSVAAGLLAVFALSGPAPASALTPEVFEGSASLPVFPCDPSAQPPGTCTGNFSGTAVGINTGSFSASYTYAELPAQCPAEGTASGTFSGAVSGTFTWSRTGLVAFITPNGGGTTAALVAVFVPTAVNVCSGGPMTAFVAGAGSLD